MSLIYEGNQVELICNGCKAVFPQVMDKDDLEILLSDSRDRGWRKHKGADGKSWHDSCPRCVKNWLRDGAKKPAGTDEKQGRLI